METNDGPEGEGEMLRVTDQWRVLRPGGGGGLHDLCCTCRNKQRRL